MRLFLPAIPHTVTHRRFSHCAFTMKVLNACKMWTSQGLHVVHLGVEGSDVLATEHVELLARDEHLQLLGISSYDDDDPTAFVGDRAKTGHPVYQQFNHYLRDELKERLAPGDVICLPFGYAHETAIKGLDIIERGDVAVIETGIGYPNPWQRNRVYESEAWRHWVLGSEQREGTTWDSPRHEWVVPNYYDVDEWHAEMHPTARSTVVFLGRLNNLKGLQLVPELARRRRDLTFVLCGQGDPSPYCVEPNVVYKPPIHGRERAAYLGNALCGLFPSRFVEPFCGAAVETMLCGTPVITSDFGAFTETVVDGVTGIRCRELQSWLDALDRVEQLDRLMVAMSATERYSIDAVGPRYAQVFAELEQSMQERVTC